MSRRLDVGVGLLADLIGVGVIGVGAFSVDEFFFLDTDRVGGGRVGAVRVGAVRVGVVRLGTVGLGRFLVIRRGVGRLLLGCVCVCVGVVRRRLGAECDRQFGGDLVG